MQRPSDPDALWEKLIGLGDRSHRKSYYPELQIRLEELKRFRDVLNQSNDCIFLLEVPGGKIIDANVSACRMLGVDLDELLVLNIFRISGLWEIPEAKKLLTATQPLERSLGPLETVLFPKEGESLPVEVTLNRQGSGARDYVAAVGRDVSERRRADDMLSERRRLAELGAMVGKGLTEEEDLRASLQRCAEAFEQQTDAVFVRIWTLDPSETVLELQASAGMYTHINGQHSRIDLRNYPYKLGIICRERRPYLTNNVIGDPQFHNQKWARKEGIVAFAGYPLILQERLIGVIGMFSRIALSDVVLMAISSVSHEIAIGIERHNALEALKVALRRTEEGRDRIDTILRSVADALLVTSMEGRIIHMNRRFEGLVGSSQGLSLGQPIAQVVRNPVLREYLNELLDYGECEPLADFEMFDFSRNEIRMIQARSAQVRNKKGVLTAMVTTLRDVTREREIDRMKSEFITTAAHELRTPLTSVKGFTELLLTNEGFPPTERQEYLAHVLGNAQTLERIVDELLDLSRIESGRAMTLNRSQCDMRLLLQQAIRSHQCEFPSYRFVSEFPETELTLMVDATKIRGVMNNLLGNAIKYSGEGSMIRISCTVKKDTLRVMVQDEGIGMSNEQLEHCFDKFYRANTADTAVGGLGLGLAIAKADIEAHGGRVWGESQEGVGTKMVFTLPLVST